MDRRACTLNGPELGQVGDHSSCKVRETPERESEWSRAGHSRDGLQARGTVGTTGQGQLRSPQLCPISVCIISFIYSFTHSLFNDLLWARHKDAKRANTPPSVSSQTSRHTHSSALLLRPSPAHRPAQHPPRPPSPEPPIPESTSRPAPLPGPHLSSFAVCLSHWDNCPKGRDLICLLDPGILRVRPRVK